MPSVFKDTRYLFDANWQFHFMEYGELYTP